MVAKVCARQRSAREDFLTSGGLSGIAVFILEILKRRNYGVIEKKIE
jgi:hypothetical protein